MKIYFPFDNLIQVDKNCVKHCPDGFTAGFYWYGGKGRGPGCPPRWLETVLRDDQSGSPHVDSPAPPEADTDEEQLTRNEQSTMPQVDSDNANNTTSDEVLTMGRNHVVRRTKSLQQKVMA